MGFSFWSHKCQYEATLTLPQAKAYHALLEYYRNSSRSFHLLDHPGESSLEFTRGSLLMSITGMGSECKFKHRITVILNQASTDTTLVKWSIDMKNCGFQVGSNAIIEECKRLAAEY